MKALIGLLLGIGVSRSGRRNLNDFWDNKGTGLQLVYCTMSINRFRFLLRVLRFDDLEGPFQQSNKVNDVVLRVLEPLFDLGCTVTMDNYFTSLSTSLDLLKKSITVNPSLIVRKSSEMETEAFNRELLIDEIEKRPAMWDMTSSDYSDKNLRRRAWEELVNEEKKKIL
ncbi:hypothetical protein HW555_008150, partial [Spodoptera exigua]